MSERHKEKRQKGGKGGSRQLQENKGKKEKEEKKGGKGMKERIAVSGPTQRKERKRVNKKRGSGTRTCCFFLAGGLAD